MSVILFPSVVREPGSPHSPKKPSVTTSAPKCSRLVLPSKGRSILFTLLTSAIFSTPIVQDCESNVI